MRRLPSNRPLSIHRLLHDSAAEIGAVAAALRRRRPRFAIFAARGTSDHAAFYGKYLAEIELGLPAGLVSPSSSTVYGARPDLREVLFIAVSRAARLTCSTASPPRAPAVRQPSPS